MEITLQYFDGCPNWEVLDRRLAELLDGRSDIRVTRQLVETAEHAERLGFHGSPYPCRAGRLSDRRATARSDFRPGSDG